MDDFRLHPDALAVRVDDDRLQLRVPDGHHLTFDAHAEPLHDALSALRGGARPAEVATTLGADLAAELFALLDTRGLLVPRAAPGGQYDRQLEQHLAGGGRLALAAPPRAWHIVGSGRLAAIAARALPAGRAAGADHAAHAADVLTVAISDADDQAALLAANAQAVQAGRPITFVRWDQRRLLIGPYVVPGQSACLDCVNHRQFAAALHPDELLAWRRAADRHGRFEGGPVLDDFAAAAIARHVTAILAGAHELARPGAVAMLDPITLDCVTAPVLRLPRCPTCRPAADRVPRAIRDLN